MIIIGINVISTEKWRAFSNRCKVDFFSCICFIFYAYLTTEPAFLYAHFQLVLFLWVDSLRGGLCFLCSRPLIYVEVIAIVKNHNYFIDLYWSSVSKDCMRVSNTTANGWGYVISIKLVQSFWFHTAFIHNHTKRDIKYKTWFTLRSL